MLPSKGFFKEELCPLYEIGDCERPYCHFRHKRIDPSNVDEIFKSFEEAIDQIPIIRPPPRKEHLVVKEEPLEEEKEEEEEEKTKVGANNEVCSNKDDPPDNYPKPSKVPRLSSDEVNQLQVSTAPHIPAECVDSVIVPDQTPISNNIDVAPTSELEKAKSPVEEKRSHRLSENEKNGIETIVKLLKADPSRIAIVENLLKSLGKSDENKSERRSSSSHSSRRRSSSHKSSHRSSKSSQSRHKSSHKRSRSRSRESSNKKRRESSSGSRNQSSKSRRSSESSSKDKNSTNNGKKTENEVHEKKSSSENEDENDSDENKKEIENSPGENEETSAVPEISDDEINSAIPELSDDESAEEDDGTSLEEQMGKLHDATNNHSATSASNKRRIAHETAHLADHDMLRNRVGVKKAFVRPADRQSRQPPPPAVVEPPRPTPLHPLLGAPRARIMAVPNAHRLLAAKVNLQKTIVKPEGNSTISRTVKPGSTREAHKPIDDDILRPVAPAGSLSVPQAIRQSTVIRLYTELKYLPSKSERRDESLRLEEQIFRTHKDSFKKYQLSTVSAIMKAKRGLPKQSSSYKIESEFFRTSRELILTNEELVANGFPMYLEEGYATCFFSEEFRYNKKYRHIKEAMERGKRYCVRCAKTYDVDQKTGEQTPVPDACLFHSDRSMRRYRGEAPTHKCCNSSVGCQSESTHVTDTKDYQRLPNCVRTSSKLDAEKYHKVLALDCEMVYTRLGIELAQITVVDSDCNIVYETLVKPSEVVEDYNTQFSGITESKLKYAKKTLRDVQRDLLDMISEETIVVGHSLDSDFRAMHFIHESVCDTSFIYRKESDAQGSYFKMRLKDLSAYHLGKIIQEGLDGHSAAEDAIAAMQLLLHKVYPNLRKDCTHCS